MFLLLLPYMVMPDNLLVVQPETERITGLGIKRVKNGISLSKRLGHWPCDHSQRFAEFL